MIKGFVSGCFDWSHPGHVVLFQKARALCDELHVLMADDETVRYYKGVGRPLIPYEYREIQVKAYEAVDSVHRLRKLPNDNNQEALIQKILPTLYFEGVDATDQEIGAILTQYGIARHPLETLPLHITYILREYDITRYDQTRQGFVDLHKAAGL